MSAGLVQLSGVYSIALMRGAAPCSGVLINGLKNILARESYHLCMVMMPVFTIPGSIP